MEARLALNSPFSCLSFPSVEITGVRHHAGLMFPLGGERVVGALDVVCLCFGNPGNPRRPFASSGCYSLLLAFVVPSANTAEK